MARKKKKKLVDIAYDIYYDLYENATPSANFYELVENAEIMEDGRKKINYEDYEIDGDLMDLIIEKHLKINKLNKRERQAMKIEIYLGVSPVTKKNKLILNDY